MKLTNEETDKMETAVKHIARKIRRWERRNRKREKYLLLDSEESNYIHFSKETKIYESEEHGKKKKRRRKEKDRSFRYERSDDESEVHKRRRHRHRKK